MIAAAQVNATIGVGEALLAMLQELRSRSKEEKRGLKIASQTSVSYQIKIPMVKGETLTAHRSLNALHGQLTSRGLRSLAGRFADQSGR